ncbi:MAG TPA: HAMP domain-containing histidine kinase [Planctomycetes bacterium]|nr:HAMP domain-containing histidine kinase [Planctomycetota bacterium]
MRVSLELRVLALVFGMNALVFALGGAFVLSRQIESAERLEQGITEDLLATIRRTIRPEGLNVPRILRWPSWGFFEDAMVVDSALSEDEGGRVRSHGIALNPLGSRHRRGDFDVERILVGVREALDLGSSVDGVEGGRVVPIPGPEGEGWGGIWFRSPDRIDERGLLGIVVRWFALSTLFLTLVTYFGMRRLVLDPVDSLAEGARRVRAGDFSVRLTEPRRRDEMADLIRSFNLMTGTVEGFNRRLEEEVERATETARRAEAAAMTQRRLAAMGELAAGVAHEINNPLGGLENAVSALEREDIDPERRRRYLELLSGGLKRIGETVNRLRRFTPRPFESEAVDLDRVVADAVELVRHRADTLGVEIHCEGLQPGRCTVSGSRSEIGHAVLNLLTNSLDALAGVGSDGGGEGARIDVIFEPADAPEEAPVPGAPGVRLRVRDNGPGVSEEELGRVQDLFYTTKDVGEGTGLGLALVSSTLRRHGGCARVRSERGRFFEVTLWFPREEQGGESG